MDENATMTMKVSEFMDLVGGVILNGIDNGEADISPMVDKVGEILTECIKLARDCGYIN